MVKNPAEKFGKRFDAYFCGWERYGLISDTGEIATVYPDEMTSTCLCLNASDQIYVGVAQEARASYALYENLPEKDLEQHRIEGRWKPGRLVIEDDAGNYHVWVRYYQEIATERETNKWAKISDQSKIIHCDGRTYEKDPARFKGMSVVLDKLAKYYGQYELGVYKEATQKVEGKVWAVEAKDHAIGYLKAMNAKGHHIFIRPKFENEPYFMMHDDVNKEGLSRCHKNSDGHWKPGRLVVESSPDNYQVWVKSDRPLSLDEKKHWLKHMRSDPGASPLHRWGRAPGFRNRKEKHRTGQGYPLAKLEWVDWQGRANVPVIELRKEEQKHTAVYTPLGEILNRGDLPTRDSYFKGVDSSGKIRESEQDIAYMMALLKRGVDDATIQGRVRSERTDWQNHKGEKRTEQYLMETLKKAKAFVGSSGYTVDIFDKEKKTKLKTVVVENIPSGKGHEAYLAQRARDIVVKEGYEPKTITVDVQRFRIQDADKSKGFSMSKEMTK